MPENRMASIIEILKHQLFFLFCSFPFVSTIFSMKLFVPGCPGSFKSHRIRV